MQRCVRVRLGTPDRLRLLRQAALLVVTTFLACGALGRAFAAAEAYRPGVTIALEVRTPQGDLRSFQRPGQAPSYWAQNMPVVKGDQVTITPLITTGGAELGEMTVRLDQSPQPAPSAPPYRVQVDTSPMSPGYHLVEVWAATKAPRRAENSAAVSFLLVPSTDPLLQVLNGEVAPGPAATEEERLAVAIRSLDPRVDKEIAANASAEITAETLFSITATPAVKEYFYTLSRDGAVTYTSPRLPISTQIVIAPLARGRDGLASGKVILTVRGGDGAGRFGARAWATLDIVSPEAAE